MIQSSGPYGWSKDHLLKSLFTWNVRLHVIKNEENIDVMLKHFPVGLELTPSRTVYPCYRTVIEDNQK